MEAIGSVAQKPLSQLFGRTDFVAGTVRRDAPRRHAFTVHPGPTMRPAMI
ncbi:MAG: hypothetical protein JRH01_05380 [Deltaproteobacteria bacterium]|nr:hypothetical protein [Deltaproteobacteria bacterium]MBW2392707.1 hypothetical protein [Deltaproteobacteria bacterium]